MRADSLSRVMAGMSLAALLGCEGPGLERFDVSLDAVSAEGEALPGVRFWASGRDLGLTDGRGHLEADITGRPGDVLEVAATCPSGYSGPTASRRLPLQHHESPSALKVTCRSLTQLAALVVRADHAGPLHLPIEVDGEVLGQTNASGHDHILLRLRPNTPVRVRVDTGAHPELRPRDPVRVFQPGTTNSILLFDQSFAAATPPPRRRPQPVSRKPKRPLPFRIE